MSSQLSYSAFADLNFSSYGERSSRRFFSSCSVSASCAAALFLNSAFPSLTPVSSIALSIFSSDFSVSDFAALSSSVIFFIASHISSVLKSFRC